MDTALFPNQETCNLPADQPSAYLYKYT